MLLVVDIGNTHTVLGIYDQDRLIHMWRLATNVEYTSDELRIKLRALLSAEEIDAGVIKGAILCSVVPALTHNWEKACERSFGVAPQVVSARSCAHLLNIDKTSFVELGADRVADAVAAKAIFGAPVVVVDFGNEHGGHRQGWRVRRRRYRSRRGIFDALAHVARGAFACGRIGGPGRGDRP